jgi:hypothetical protein
MSPFFAFGAVDCDNCGKKIRLKADRFSVRRIGKADFFVCEACRKLPKFSAPYVFDMEVS